MISSFARVLDYERAGYGLSEGSPDPPNAVNIARELGALLHATGIEPPYVTVGHSWGGVLTMEFMSTRADDVAGMVFVDAGVPHYWDHLPMAWREPSMAAVSGDLDFVSVTGMKGNTALSPQEWAAMLAEESSEKHERQAAEENEEFEGTYAALAKKGLLEKSPPVLGDRPVCVVRGHTNRDFEKMYRAGVAAGNGSEEERKGYREVLKTWAEKDIGLQKEFFKMSTKGHFVQAPESSGHNIQLTDPQCIADGVRWTLEHLAT